MATNNISDKLDYLDGTKQAIRNTLINKGQDVPANATFRSYTTYINNLHQQIDPSHKLASDLVDDTNQNNKFVTQEEKSQINTNKNNIALCALITETGNKIDLEINSSTYVLTAKLYDKNNNLLSTSNPIDLPLETMVVGASYDSTTQEIVLTLKNGTTVRFSVAALVSGLQPEITSDNKLASDLVDDTNQAHKFITATERTTWNGKVSPTDYASTTTGGTIRLNDGFATDKSSDGKLRARVKTYAEYTDADNQMFVGKGTLENVITGKNLESANNKVSTLSSTSTNDEYPGAKCVYDLIGDIESALEELDTGGGVQ